MGSAAPDPPVAAAPNQAWVRLCQWPAVRDRQLSRMQPKNLGQCKEVRLWEHTLAVISAGLCAAQVNECSALPSSIRGKERNLMCANNVSCCRQDENTVQVTSVMGKHSL